VTKKCKGTGVEICIIKQDRFYIMFFRVKQKTKQSKSCRGQEETNILFPMLCMIGYHSSKIFQCIFIVYFQIVT
jgi:hypothetical protein